MAVKQNQKNLSKVEKVFEDLENLKKIASQCNFLTILDNNEELAFQTLFKELGIQHCLKTRNEKSKIKNRIKNIFCRNISLSKKVSFQWLYTNKFKAHIKFI